MKTARNARRMLSETLRLYHLLPRYEPARVDGASITVKDLPAGAPVRIISHRTAIFTGTRPLRATFDVPIREVRLSDDDGVWMTTTLEELSQLVPAVRALRNHRRVLVGGLGLGVIAHLLAEGGADVTVVENAPAIADLVGPLLHPRVGVVVADLFGFLRDLRPGQYDAAYYDIWRSTGEWTWQTQVVPLRRLSAGKVYPVLCWQEHEMHGQVESGLFRSAGAKMNDRRVGMSWQHYWTWRRGIEPLIRRQPVAISDIEASIKLEQKNRADPALRQLARLFLRGVGTSGWERVFGRFWDESLRLAKEEQSDVPT